MVDKSFTEGYVLAKEDLRLEAIKWIKTPDMELWDLIENIIEDGDVNDMYMFKIGLKFMYNITEEDLK